MITEEMLVKAAREVDMAILDMLPDPSECTHVFSESFQRKMKKLIRRANHYIAYKILRCAACILMSLLLSASMFLAFNVEARAAVIDWVKEQVRDFYQYFFVAESSSEEPQVYSLDWVPEGYMVLDSFAVQNGETYIYLNDSGEMLQFTYVYGTDSNALLVGQGEYELKYITEGDLQGELYIAMDAGETNGITWKGENGKVMFSISGFVDEESLIKMAKNVVVSEVK